MLNTAVNYYMSTAYKYTSFANVYFLRLEHEPERLLLSRSSTLVAQAWLLIRGFARDTKDYCSQNYYQLTGLPGARCMAIYVLKIIY